MMPRRRRRERGSGAADLAESARSRAGFTADEYSCTNE